MKPAMNKTAEKIGNYRWRIVAFLFFATTINYIDRQILGVLAPFLQKDLNWSETDYSFIVMAFQAAYAIGLVTMGNVLDKIGTKIGYIIAMITWSLASVFHAVCSGFLSFGIMRFILGIGQSANFPAAVKTIAEWFPKKERALATGLFNTGSNAGAVITPLVVPLIVLHFNWKVAFIVTGLLGFIWLIFWWLFYSTPDKNKILKAPEKKYILEDDVENKSAQTPWRDILKYKQTLGICLARFFTDPIWWFFLFWLAKFLNSKFGIDLQHIGLPLFTIYLVSTLGSIAGGWISSFLIKRGKSPVKARLITILLMALLVVPIFFASMTSHVWVAIGLISLATFAHQGFAANIFTIVSDIYPKNAIGSMVGLSGFSGAIGGFIFAPLVGLILQITGNYYIIFAIASLAYLLCWLSLKIFVPDRALLLNAKK
jgi:ACS family hexuronate transporter-like MFS transporter